MQLLPNFFKVDLKELHQGPAWTEISKVINPAPRPLSSALMHVMRPLMQWDSEVYEYASALVAERIDGCREFMDGNGGS